MKTKQVKVPRPKVYTDKYYFFYEVYQYIANKYPEIGRKGENFYWDVRDFLIEMCSYDGEYILSLDWVKSTIEDNYEDNQSEAEAEDKEYTFNEMEDFFLNYFFKEIKKTRGINLNL